MSKFFGGIFGRAEKPAPTPTNTIIIDGEEYDIEYVRYCIEKDRTVGTLEAKLHESDDPQLIAQEALKAACHFHGGDWAGILDVDLELDMWTPLWWYNAAPQDKTTSLFGEFQLAKSMPNWIEALKNGTSVCLTDMAALRREHPEEYEVYKHLKVNSVIGVPFGPNPVGILAIRNPTRYIKSRLAHQERQSKGCLFFYLFGPVDGRQNGCKRRFLLFFRTRKQSMDASMSCLPF